MGMDKDDFVFVSKEDAESVNDPDFEKPIVPGEDYDPGDFKIEDWLEE